MDALTRPVFIAVFAMLAAVSGTLTVWCAVNAFYFPAMINAVGAVLNTYNALGVLEDHRAERG